MIEEYKKEEVKDESFLSWEMFKETSKKVKNIKGRSSRKQFWNYQLYSFLLTIILAIGMGIAIKMGKYGAFMSLLFILPIFFMSIANLSLSVRRLHDTSKSAFWLLTSFIPMIGPFIYLYLMGVEKGDEGENKYGEMPIESKRDEKIAKIKNHEKVNFFSTETDIIDVTEKPKFSVLKAKEINSKTET